VPPDVPVLLDCKRADVPNTMAAYASAVFDAMEFDAATVHAYHGADSLPAFARSGTRGVYVVCHTSNPGRADLQHIPSGDAPLFMAVARLAVRSNDREHRRGHGATAPAEAAAVRAAFPGSRSSCQESGDRAGTSKQRSVHHSRAIRRRASSESRARSDMPTTRAALRSGGGTGSAARPRTPSRGAVLVPTPDVVAR